MAFVVSSTMILAACNTVQGAGEDIESVGESAEEEIN